jgi:ATP-dependent Clp protease ATP-binding subunit ClpX
LVGRLPVVATLEELGDDALIDILIRPKNAIVKQYQKLFEMDGVQLVFEPEALQAIARRTADRKTGARGLRAVLEKSMLEIMYDLPTRGSVRRVTIGEKTIVTGAEPDYEYEEEQREGA